MVKPLVVVWIALLVMIGKVSQVAFVLGSLYLTNLIGVIQRLD